LGESRPGEGCRGEGRRRQGGCRREESRRQGRAVAGEGRRVVRGGRLAAIGVMADCE
jgi:hypothetical protein